MAEFPPYLENVSFGAVLRPSKQRFKKLAQLLTTHEPRWPRRPADLYGADVRDKTMWLAHLLIEEAPARDEFNAGFSADFQWSVHELRRKPTAKQMDRYSRDLETLESTQSSFYEIPKSAHWHCRVQWRFPREAATLSIPLPFIKGASIWGVLDQVTGVRFTSTVDTFAAVIVDSDEQHDRILVSAEFAFWQRMTAHLLEAVVTRAKDLIIPVITEEQIGDGHDTPN